MLGDAGVLQMTAESRMLSHWLQSAKKKKEFDLSFLPQTDVQHIIEARWEGCHDD